MNALPEGSIRSLLQKRHRALLRSLALRVSLRAAAVAAACITLALLWGAIVAPGVGGAWARLGWLALAVMACIALGVRRFRRRAPAFDGYLEHVEERFPQVRSLLRNAVDFGAAGAAQGTSAELANAVTQKTSSELSELPLPTLAPRLAPLRPLGAFAACFALVVAATLFAPRAVQRSWATLWNPASAAPPVTLKVEPGSVKVTPGASLTVVARVAGTDSRPRIDLGDAKAVAAIEDGTSGGEHLWRFDLVQLTREQDYRVRVAQEQSPNYHIAMAGDPLPLSFEVEYRSPAYARLPVQRGSALRGDLSALRGTRAVVDVTFDRDLQQLDAALPAAGGTIAWKSVSARRWRGEVPIDRDGEYELHAVAKGGEGRFRYRIQPLADAPPLIAVRTPEGDQDLPAGQQVPLEVIGQDDLGLTELRLEYRKGDETTWTSRPLANFPGRPRETQVRSQWDASSLGLLPGETAAFRFVLFDDDAVSGRNRAESPVFELRFPSIANLYDDIDRTQNNVQNTLEKVATQAKELQKSLEKLGRQQPRQNPQSSPAFERAEELKSNLGRQQELAKQLDQATQQLQETLAQAEERQAFQEDLQRKLQEMSKLMQQIQSKEFRDALEKMEKALENLDRKSLESQLPQWQQENKEMLQNLERTLELLKKLREEERLESLAQRADELKKQQDQLNQQHAENQQKQSGQNSAENQKAAQKQEEAARRTEELAKEVQQAAQENESQPQQSELQKTAQSLQQDAAQQQHQASKSSQQNQSSQAQKQGQKASESLSQAAQQLQQMAQENQQEQNSLDLAAVRRSAQDLVSLQRESEGNMQNGAPADERANKQTDLSEGVARVADSLGVLSQRTPFLSPKLTESLGRAMNQLSQSGKDLATGNRARGEQAGREGSTALNQAILELRNSESSMCKQPGQGQGKQPGMSQQMSDLGKQQSQLNQRSRNLAQRLSQQMRLGAGDPSELQRMSAEQQRLREQLEQIQRDDEARNKLLGRLDTAQREMKEVEEELRAGNLGDDLEQKQTRILSRLLDASRSLNRRDFDPRRESRPGEALADRSAAPLAPSLLREDDRLRLDLLKADADRYPAQYRAFVEAYLRALNGPRR